MAAAPKRRVRNLLQSYYGIGQADRTVADATDIDAPNFDADQYVASIIREKSLTELLVRENTLSSEVKTLDSEMQMLVYENYNKFISATDTIRKMKTDVEGMEGDLKNLSKSIEYISDKSDTVNSNLADRRVRIEQLNGVRRLLKKLQFLFELPSRLNRAVELEAFGEAVRYWSGSSNILKQYSHMPAFQAIKAECDQILNKLKMKLRNKMTNENTGALELSEAVDLLLKLHDNETELSHQYFKCRKQRLLKSLHSQTLTTSEEGDSGIHFNAAFLLEAEDFVISYHSLFLQQAPTPSTTTTTTTTASSSLEDTPGRAQLVQTVKDSFAEYFAAVRNALLQHKGSTEDVIRDVELWHADMQRVHSLLPEAKLATESERIVEEVGRFRVSVALQQLTNDLWSHISNMATAAPPSQQQQQQEHNDDDSASNAYASVVRTALDNIVDSIGATLKNLQPLTVTETVFMSRYSRFFSDLVHEELRHLIESMANNIWKNAEEGSTDPKGNLGNNGMFTLLCARLWTQLRTDAMQKILRFLMDNVPVSAAHLEASSDFLLFQPKQVSAGLSATTQRLIQHYIQIRTKSISDMIHKSVDTFDWSKKKEARDVRFVIICVLEELTGVGNELQSLISDIEQEAPAQYENEVLRRAQSSSSTAFNRMFSGSMKVIDLNTVILNSQSILHIIIKLSLRTMLECVRLQRFGRTGYQQMQVDLHFFRIMLNMLTHNAPFIDFLLDEVLQTVSDRCDEPTPMDTSIVESICENKRAKYAGQ